MEHVSNRSTLRGNVVYTDHYVSTFLRRYFLRRYSFPYDESKGIDARNIIGGERNHDVFTRITVSRWEFRFLSGSNILITSNLVDFHARFFCPSRIRFRGSLNRYAGEKYTSCANLYTRGP